jgi:serine O-acetyltransferase
VTHEVGVTARKRLRADIARYLAHSDAPLSRYRRARTVAGTEAIWAIAVFRFGQYVYHEAGRLPRLLLKPFYEWIAGLVGRVVGIHLFPEASIGPGLYIGHYGGIWISPLATLGANCNIGPNVVIGVAGRGRSKGPVLGDRVWVGPGAVITGPVNVGSGAVIGANSLVATNIAENAVAVGVPARVISYTGSSSLIRLPEETA